MNHQSSTAPFAFASSIPPRFAYAPIERWIDAEPEHGFPTSDPPSWALGTAQPELPGDTQERNS